MLMSELDHEPKGSPEHISYALLPTADIANAVLTSMPSYDVNLFLNGVLQVAHGDPMGLIHAVGYPIAADAALLTAAGGWELIVLVNAIALMLGGQLSG